MKHKNLQLLLKHGINIPKFIVVRPGEPIDLSFSDADLFAVRSSFSTEDNSSTSFAGQFDTFLNVKREDIAKTVIKVAESAKSKTVRAYQSALGVSSFGEMNIIIQEMVDPELSGVIFTANPCGILNEMVVVVGEGLGNNVVEDRIATTSYFYNRDDGIYHYVQQDSSPTVSEETLMSLIKVADIIRDILGYHADIEYCIMKDKVYILQARPITTLDERSPIVLDNSNIVESYPGVSLPLTQDFVKEIYYGIFHRLIQRITNDQALVNSMDKYLVYMVDVANWRIYYRISNWYAVLKLLPFSKIIIPIWQKMMGISNTLVTCPDDIVVSAAAKCTVFRSFLHYLKHTPRYMDELNQNFEKRFTSYSEDVDKCETPAQLIEVYGKIKADILGDWDLTLINDMYTFIYTALSGKRNKELIANVKNLASMKPVEAMGQLVACAQQYGIDSNNYKKSAEEYIDLYGDRCLGELKLETETYRTNPAKLDDSVKKRIHEESFSTRISESQIRDSNPFVRRAKLGIKNREISRLNRSRIFGLTRNIFLRIGEFHAKNGQLDSERDVFYLRMEELLSNRDMKDIVNERRMQREHFENVMTYNRLVFAGEIINQTCATTSGNVLNRRDTLTGIPSSVGRAQGEVLVVDVPDDKIDTTGKILVAKSTDPGWVFLIQGAIGIIAEKGSLLSHTAIISRELHKPAVVGVKDCTKLLKNGDFVELDAYEGTIKMMNQQ